jgi:hypothetical protein
MGLLLLLLALGFGTVLGGCVLLARRLRTSGAGVAIVGPLEEAWNPAAHRQRTTIQMQAELAPAPGTPDKRAPEEAD